VLHPDCVNCVCHSAPRRDRQNVAMYFRLPGMQGYVNLKGYGEFDAHDRASGWNAGVTFSTSPIAPHVAKNEASLMGR
jgi:hypothetical protein